MANELIMNVTPGETRIARLEGGTLSELSIERDSEEQVAGNIYLGRINRVLPGMQAAFVDIGLEKAAFLYVADVVPDLFDGIDDVDDEERADVVLEVTSEAVLENVNPTGDESAPTEGSAPEGAEGDDKGSHKGKYQKHKPRPKRAPLPRIEDVVKEGQTIVVQVAKEPIRTKGARVTSHISLPGRYLVYMPTVSRMGVSRRITSFEERQRLKTILTSHKPAMGGFIARTNCVGAPDEKIIEDMKNLVEIWQGIYQRKEKSRAPNLIYKDLDLVLRVVRDNLSTDVDRLVIDSPEYYSEIGHFVDKFMPDLKSRVVHFDRETPIFDVYGIESEINRALSKKVWLKSGGYLIIDSSEALTSIDVNTGKFVGKKDFDETVLTTNLEAAEEIAYQLKLRSIGGIIILDFIDMQRYAHRMKVYNALRDCLKRDRVRTTISKISDLGLIEMTRKRTRDSLTQMLSTTCPHCHGTGYVKTALTVAFETFREVKRVYQTIAGRSLLIRCNPKVAKVLFNEGRSRLEQVEKNIGKRITVETDEKLHIEQFEIRARQVA